MALGGGVWFSQNKKLPGSYINFISRITASTTIGSRGVAAIGMSLDWGIDGEMMEITGEDFVRNSLKYFGFVYTDSAVRWLREIFRNATKVYVYKLNSSDSGKSSNTYATAKCSGMFGNNLKIKISANVNDANLWDVVTLMSGVEVDSQTVASAANLKDNDFVTFKKNATLAATAGLSLTGGTHTSTTAENHVTFMNLLESYTDVNAVGVANDESASGALQLNAVYAAWCKRMRDEVGFKVQVVMYNYAADYEGVVNVKNAVNTPSVSKAGLVYWVLGLIAGSPINGSATNKLYDGELDIDTNYTQAQLEACIDAGEFVLHKVGNDVRVLVDINSLTTTTTDKGDLFKANQTIRVIDDMANQIAATFNTKYLGIVPNDDDGRAALWADIVGYCRELDRIRAIENFDEESVTVEQGNSKRAVLVNCALTIINAMEQLYMTTIIS